MSDASFSEPHWSEEAACRTVDGSVFFPVPTGGNARTRDDESLYDRAKAVCAACGVVDECLRAALERSEPDGCWGGTTPNERRAMGMRRRPRGMTDRKRARGSAAP